MKFTERLRAAAFALFGAGDPLRRRGQAFISPQQADMWVDDRTALTFSAYWCAIRVVSETLAVLDWSVYKAGAKEGTKEKHTASPVQRLINYKANPELSAMAFRELIARWALGWGNGYAEIERDAYGRPLALWPIHPTRILRVIRIDDVLGYDVQTDAYGRVFLPWKDTYHIRGPGDDQFLGLSMVQLAARTLGLGLAQDQHMATFLANGASVSGVLTHPRRLSEDARTNLKESWKQAYEGPKKAGKTALLEEGVKYEKLGIPPGDAKLLESRQFTIEEVARWFRVPPHKLMVLTRATHGNVEQMGVEFVQDAIMPWAKRFEVEADIKMLRLDSQYTKMDLKTLMRGDSQARGQYYQLLRNIGVLSANDIREAEDYNPIGAEGDKYVMQSAMTTLEKIGEDPAPGTQGDLFGGGDGGGDGGDQPTKRKQGPGFGNDNPGGRPANLSIVKGKGER